MTPPGRRNPLSHQRMCRGCSASQAECRGFKSLRPLHFNFVNFRHPASSFAAGWPLARSRSTSPLRRMTKQDEGCGRSTGTVVGKVAECRRSQRGAAQPAPIGEVSPGASVACGQSPSVGQGSEAAVIAQQAAASSRNPNFCRARSCSCASVVQRWCPVPGLNDLSTGSTSGILLAKT